MCFVCYCVAMRVLWFYHTYYTSFALIHIALGAESADRFTWPTTCLLSCIEIKIQKPKWVGLCTHSSSFLIIVAIDFSTNSVQHNYCGQLSSQNHIQIGWYNSVLYSLNNHLTNLRWINLITLLIVNQPNCSSVLIGSSKVSYTANIRN